MSEEGEGAPSLLISSSVAVSYTEDELPTLFLNEEGCGLGLMSAFFKETDVTVTCCSDLDASDDLFPPRLVGRAWTVRGVLRDLLLWWEEPRPPPLLPSGTREANVAPPSSSVLSVQVTTIACSWIMPLGGGGEGSVGWGGETSCLPCCSIMELRAEAAARSSRLIPEQHRICWRLGVSLRLPWSMWLASSSAFLVRLGGCLRGGEGHVSESAKSRRGEKFKKLKNKSTHQA